MFSNMSSLLIFLSILVLFPLILFPVFGESSPVYTEPYSPIFTDKSIYSWTDKIKITIISPSWNSDRYAIDSIGDLKQIHRINALDTMLHSNQIAVCHIDVSHVQITHTSPQCYARHGYRK